jgi:hypothetical protein
MSWLCSDVIYNVIECVGWWQLKSMVPIGDKLLKPPRNAKELMATGLLEGHYVRCSCRGEQVCHVNQIRQQCGRDKRTPPIIASDLFIFCKSFTYYFYLSTYYHAQALLGCTFSWEAQLVPQHFWSRRLSLMQVCRDRHCRI